MSKNPWMGSAKMMHDYQLKDAGVFGWLVCHCACDFFNVVVGAKKEHCLLSTQDGNTACT